MSKKKEEQPRIHVPKEGGHTVQFSRTSTDMVSYEDLLIAQYLEELRKTKGEMRKKKDVPKSPYAQRVSSATEYRYSKRRPMSATLPARPPSGHKQEKPKIDAKFIADPNLWDPATPRDRMTVTTTTTTQTQLKDRPASAPVKRKGYNRPMSATSNLSWFYNRSGRPWSGRSFGSVFSGRRIKSQYKKQPMIIRVTAFKNGTKETCARLAAPTLKIFLEMCTEKLQLPFAARRIFLEGGVEIFDADDIPYDGEVYVSCGDNYKDPLANVRRNIIISEGAKWTLSGLMLPEEGRVRTRKAKMSKRMKKLIENNRVRIVVYKNGIATEPVEVVADLSNMEDFLCACTAKLSLTSYAKVLYDWEGKEITDLNDAPILDDCFQPGNTPIRGPLWVSIGEAFNAIAAYSYIRTMKSVVISRIDDAEKYRSELQNALDGNKDTITITIILSMKKSEIEQHLEKAENEIQHLRETKQDLDEKLKNINELQKREKAEGSNFTMGHIKEFQFDHRLVGRKGLRLKVYENGIVEGGIDFYFNLSGAMKGVDGSEAREKIRQRLLDDLSSNRLLSNPIRPKILPVATNIYDQYGNDIRDVFTLQYDQEIWVSFGEPFMNPFVWMLQVQFDEAECYDLGDRTLVIRKQLMADTVQGYDSFNLQQEWDAHIGFPPAYPAKSNEYEKARAADLASSSEVDSRWHYLQSKKKEDLAMYPEVIVNSKLKKGSKDFWPFETQTWVISKRGYIYCKSCPQLCLTVSDTRVDVPWTGQNSPLNGFVVTVQKKMSANAYQQWKFNPNGTMTCMAYENLLLTYLQNKFGDEEGYMAPDGVKPGHRIYLVLADPLSKKEAVYQRFAFKQERFDNLGQWKYCDATNPEFNKLAYSWPCRKDGSLNEDYDWPMEAFIVTNAPPVHKERKEKQSGMPLRLMAIKNGERDYRFMSPVVGPDLTNMMKDLHKDNKDKSKRKSKITEEKDMPISNSDIVANDIYIHCENMTVRQLEFTMFLDHCTGMLNLPFAGRRLFDAKGNEHFSLVNLRRDDLVYVSCGESWIDPKLSKEEQQKRFLLSQLSQDVAKIRQYVALRNPEKYVLEIEGNLVPNTRMLVNRQWSRDEEDKEVVVITDSQSVKSSKQLSSRDFEEEEDNLTAHDRAHRLAEQRLNNLKWPWERLVNTGNDNDDEDPEALKYTDKEMYERYKPATVPKISRDTLQRFVFEDGYIACAANRSLVLGLLEQEGRVSQVLLVKRRPDDIHQRWVMKENGEIRSKHSNQTCLTVSMPNNEPFSEDEQGRPLTFAGCPVTLQTRKTNKYGKAHQRWHYDAETGFIHSFYADPYDKEITAANKADVCTFAISGHDNIDQPGYVAEIPISPSDKRFREYLVCTSCARAMRGRYKIQKLQTNVEFACSMGEAKKLKLQQIGSFKVLNGKVDLSTHEAQLTLEDWEHKLRTLREETNVRTIAKEISAARTVKTVKILAYKNGEGRLRPGELICGSTIEGILDQCTYRLGLNSAARRIFTEDGTMIMEIEDLVDWAVENYKTLMAEYLQGKNDKVEDLENGDVEQQTEKQALEGRERGEGEGQDSPEDAQQDQDKDDAEVDQEEAKKLAKERDMVLSQVQVPSVDTILRYPIEVWVSSGKDFVAPEIVESKIENRRKKRAFRSAVSLELDMEKHILRQMKARRLEEMDPGELKATRSSKQPVVIEGNWQEPTVEEQLKHDTVHKLETHLAEVKKNQKEPRKTLSNITQGRLYKQPDTKRVMVYPNGESVERAAYVWGDTLDEILDNATAKLGMWQKARLIYNMEGKLVRRFEDINRDELLCVSGGKPFTRPQGGREDIEIKANWTRARKEYGPSATDFTVEAPMNPKVNVDPFGPPALTMPPEETSK